MTKTEGQMDRTKNDRERTKDGQKWDTTDGTYGRETEQ